MKQLNQEKQQSNRILGHVVGEQFTAQELEQIAGGFVADCGKNTTSFPCGEGWPADCMGCKNDG
ncbi:MAG: hypothetical protein V4495_08015 [Pseudomonadota bacterium]